jgi:hypothetical protein
MWAIQWAIDFFFLFLKQNLLTLHVPFNALLLAIRSSSIGHYFIHFIFYPRFAGTKSNTTGMQRDPSG